jgi:glycosyltransferase involved in cell wall biosynthesis
MAAEFDHVLVHYETGLYFRPGAPLAKIATSLSLLWLVLRCRRTEILVHEAHPPRWWRPDHVLLTLAFRAAPMLLFHTWRERRAFQHAFGFRGRARVVPHGQGVAVRGGWSRAEARKHLGLSDDEPLFLVPGFLHPDKGVERAVQAFRSVGDTRGRLVIVGSLRDKAPSNIAYAQRLRALVDRAAGVDLVERFLDPEEFDAWIAAADAVVLAYRRSWSSGALARAQAIGTPTIVTAVGGLPEQASERDVIVESDADLARAIQGVVRSRGSSAGGRTAER